MGYIYDINTAKSDKTARIGIYICHMINNILELFLSTFLIAHIHNFSNNIYEYALNVSLYEIIGYSIMILVYHFASKLVSKTNRISIYRLSTIIWCLFVIFTIFYGQDLAKLIWLAGVFMGVSRGFYWASYNVLKQEMIGRHKMDKFATLSKVIEKFISIVFPITLGALIEVSSFSNTAIIVLVICMIQIAVSFVVKSKQPVNSDYNLKKYLKRLKNNDGLSKRMKFLYTWSVIYGANTVVSILIYICTMIQFGSNLSFGIITSIIAVATMIVAYLVGYYTKPAKRKTICILSMIISIASVLLFVFMPTKTTIVILNFALSITGMIFKLIFDIYRNKFLKEYGRYDDIAEHQGIVEYIIATSRIITYIILVGVAFMHNLLIFNILLVLFVVLFSFNFIFVVVFEKKYISNDSEEETNI